MEHQDAWRFGATPSFLLMGSLAGCVAGVGLSLSVVAQEPEIPNSPAIPIAPTIETTPPEAIAPQVTTEQGIDVSQLPSPDRPADQPPPAISNPEPSDPEPSDPELPNPELPNPELIDPELGDLLLRPVAPPRSPSPVVFAIADVGYFRSDNILLDDVDPVEDGVFRTGLTLYARPEIADDTLLTAAVSGSLARYGELSRLDYNDLRMQVGLRHYFSNQLYASLGWSHRQLFDAEDGDRLLEDHSARLLVSWQENLADNLAFNSTYQARLSFADPSRRSRFSQALGATLRYALDPDLSVGLDYQLTLTDFTERDRYDVSHQLVAELLYDLSSTTRLLVYGGFSAGNSSADGVDFEGSIVGVGWSVSLPLF